MLARHGLHASARTASIEWANNNNEKRQENNKSNEEHEMNLV
jgi:hypothetical protein